MNINLYLKSNCQNCLDLVDYLNDFKINDANIVYQKYYLNQDFNLEYFYTMFGESSTFPAVSAISFNESNGQIFNFTDISLFKEYLNHKKTEGSM